MAYVLILGAKSDIARAVAHKYAKQGYSLYLAARNSKELTRFAQDIMIRTQVDVQCVDLDILDLNSHDIFYATLITKPIGVISAIGYLGDQSKAEKDIIEAKKIIDTNYTALACLLNIIADDFEKRKADFIVGISSVAGDRGRKSNYLYGSAKAAFTAYLSGLRNRLYSVGVQVLTVKPGFVATQMTAGMDLPEKLTAQPDEVAEDIFKAQQRGKSTLYTKWIWKWIMLIIKNIPDWQFRKMNL